MRLALVCETESSGPSSVCFHGKDSGTTLSKACHTNETSQYCVKRKDTGGEQDTNHVHISPDISVKVLIETERRTRVLDEQGKHANFDALDTFFDVWHDLVRDQVAALGPRTEREGLLPRHSGCGCCYARGYGEGSRRWFPVDEFEWSWDRQDPVKQAECENNKSDVRRIPVLSLSVFLSKSSSCGVLIDRYVWRRSVQRLARVGGNLALAKRRRVGHSTWRRRVCVV